MQTRRETIKQSMVVAGLLASAGFPQFAHAAFNKVGFDAKSIQDAVKAYGGGTITESKDVTITGPDIAENGAVVPLGASTNLPGVKQLLVLVEKNPSTLVAMFHVSDAVDANFSTRAKMGQSSDVYAVAIMADEALHGPSDALELANKFAADVFAVKINQSGGLFPALQVATIAELCGISL